MRSVCFASKFLNSYYFLSTCFTPRTVYFHYSTIASASFVSDRFFNIHKAQDPTHRPLFSKLMQVHEDSRVLPTSSHATLLTHRKKQSSAPMFYLELFVTFVRELARHLTNSFRSCIACILYSQCEKRPTEYESGVTARRSWRRRPRCW